MVKLTLVNYLIFFYNNSLNQHIYQLFLKCFYCILVKGTIL